MVKITDAGPIREVVVGPHHRIPPIVGLKAMTLWAAYQHFEEKTKGSIEVGKAADFVVLSENPIRVNPLRMADIKVLETIKGGRSVYLRKEKSFAAMLHRDGARGRKSSWTGIAPALSHGSLP